MIHNKSYKTVAERLDEASKVIKSIKTEVLYITPQVMVKATIETDKGIFTGTSAANPKKTIEANSPVEVAETSAVGRALAFAGYAGSEIASADEMQKVFTREPDYRNEEPDAYDKAMVQEKCKDCGAKKIKSMKGNWYCSEKCWLPKDVN